MRRSLPLGIALLLAAGCKTEPPPPVAAPDAAALPAPGGDAPAPTQDSETPDPALVRRILTLEHARTLGPDTDGLIALSSNPDPRVRARVATALGRVGLADGVAPLLVLMDDEAPAVRAQTAFAAAILVGSIQDDEQATTDLRDGMRKAWTKEREERKDPTVREAIAWALRRFGGEKSVGVVDLLLDAFNDGDPKVSATAMQSFALLSRYTPKTPDAGKPGSVQAIRLRAADTNETTRRAATYALMRMKAKDAIPDFEQALEKRRADDERSMAVQGLTGLESWHVAQMRDLLMPPPEPTMDNLEPVDFRGDVWTKISAVNHLLAAKSEPALTVLETWLGQEILPDLTQHGIGLDAPIFHAVLAVAAGLPEFPDQKRARALLDALHRAAGKAGPLRRKDAAYAENLNAALLHCTAAASLDRLDKKVARVPDCGTGLEAVYPAVNRDILVLETQLAIAADDKAKVAALSAAYIPTAHPRLKVSLLGAASELFESGPEGEALVVEIGARALAEEDPVLRSYGVKLAARGPALLAVLKDGATTRPGHKMDVVLEALDAVKKHKPEGAIEVVLPWTASPEHAVRARARSALFALDPTAAPLPYEPALDAPQGEPGPPVTVVLRTTRGNIELELWPDQAPATVASFLALARKGTYDNLTFHRVIAGFVSQGGDPRGDGNGGPGYALPSEWTRLPYDAGTVGMAHAGKDTGGCQFFLTHRPHPHLDGGYTVFGRVTKGLDGVQAMQQGDIIRGVDIR